jgi:hypothetical protein
MEIDLYLEGEIKIIHQKWQHISMEKGVEEVIKLATKNIIMLLVPWFRCHSTIINPDYDLEKEREFLRGFIIIINNCFCDSYRIGYEYGFTGKAAEEVITVDMEIHPEALKLIEYSYNQVLEMIINLTDNVINHRLKTKKELEIIADKLVKTFIDTCEKVYWKGLIFFINESKGKPGKG